MLPMSNSDVQPGATETQQMRVMAPPGVCIPCILMSHQFLIFIRKSNIRLRLRISYTLAGQTVQDQIDFSGFPPGLTGSS
jgi:AP-1 complex subunit gamma-1